jgi:hypothetical protein
VRGIDAFDVERRIGLGIAARLCFGEHGRERRTLRAHLGQDEVGRAVDDAGDPLDPVGGEPSRNALMIGMPPHTAPSRRPSRLARGGEISLPCRARSALLACHMLAVGDRLQDERARGLEAAISSTTMSMSGCASTTAASAVRLTSESSRVAVRACSSARSPIHVIRIGRPARRAISSSFLRSTFHVPSPTVPSPRRPTCSGFIAAIPSRGTSA